MIHLGIKLQSCGACGQAHYLPDSINNNSKKIYVFREKVGYVENVNGDVKFQKDIDYTANILSKRVNVKESVKKVYKEYDPTKNKVTTKPHIGKIEKNGIGQDCCVIGLDIMIELKPLRVNMNKKKTFVIGECDGCGTQLFTWQASKDNPEAGQ